MRPPLLATPSRPRSAEAGQSHFASLVGRMIDIRCGRTSFGPHVLGVGLLAMDGGLASVDPAVVGDEALVAELAAYIADIGHKGAAGAVNILPRPSRRPSAVLLFGV